MNSKVHVYAIHSKKVIVILSYLKIVQLTWEIYSTPD